MCGLCMITLPPSAGALHQSLGSGILVLSSSQSRTVITQGKHVDFQLPSWTIVRALGLCQDMDQIRAPQGESRHPYRCDQRQPLM